MKRLLIVDLLAERQAFGEKGCEEIIRHFPGHDVFLWSPHIENPRKYPFGTRVKQPLMHGTYGPPRYGGAGASFRL